MRVKLILFSCLSLSCFANAESNINAIINQAGAYVAAADINEKLNLSKCGSYIERKNPLTTKLAISQVLARLPQKERIEIEAYFTSSDFKKNIAAHEIILEKMISEFSKKRNLDFSCGLVMGLTVAKNEMVFNAWSTIK